MPTLVSFYGLLVRHVFSLFLSLLPLLVLYVLAILFVLYFLAFLVLSFLSLLFSFCRFFVFSFFFLIFFTFVCCFIPIDLRLSCACVVTGTTCKIYVVVFLGWQAEQSVVPGPSSESYASVWTWHILGRLSISLLCVFGGGMNCVRCDICVLHLWFACVFPWGISHPQRDRSLSHDHGLDYAR